MYSLTPLQPRKTIVALAALALVALAPGRALAQGCMATRVSPPMLGLADSSQYLQEGQYETSFSFRHYESSRHFYGFNNEQVPANAPRVMRSILDASITYMATTRSSITMSVPYQWGGFDRSPVPPHLGSRDRAVGLGDIALTYRYWLLDPTTNTEHNLRIGIGLKLPTGNDATLTDRLVNIAPPGQAPNLQWQRGPADIAIQPGDGGFGIILGLEGFQHLTRNVLLYGEVTYLANPRGNNGVNNQWSGAGPYVPDPVTSVPDYFLGRAGVTLAEPLGIRAASALLGVRAEGQPIRDLIGNNSGFRRPGCTVAIEPGAGYGFGKWSAFLSVPITVYRMRWRSVDELYAGRRKAVTAAFADYNIIAGVTRRW
jgi:hypothetical protein